MLRHNLPAGDAGKTMQVRSASFEAAAGQPAAVLLSLPKNGARPGDRLVAFGDSQVRTVNKLSSADSGQTLTWQVRPGSYLLAFLKPLPPVEVPTVQSSQPFTYTVTIE